VGEGCFKLFLFVLLFFVGVVVLMGCGDVLFHGDDDGDGPDTAFLPGVIVTLIDAVGNDDGEGSRCCCFFPTVVAAQGDDTFAPCRCCCGCCLFVTFLGIAVAATLFSSSSKILEKLETFLGGLGCIVHDDGGGEGVGNIVGIFSGKLGGDGSLYLGLIVPSSSSCLVW